MNAQAGNAAAHAKDLRGWVETLVDEYGLHAQIGPPDRWENIPPLRAELLGLKIADVRRLKLEQGSFELIYWHDALARIVDRAGQHAERWQQDQQNQQLLDGPLADGPQPGSPTSGKGPTEPLPSDRVCPARDAPAEGTACATPLESTS